MSSKPTPNAYVVLQQYMVEGLGLTGDELIVYAIIYGFCLDGKSSCRCTREYFAYWLGKSKTTVCRVIDSLCEKGCIVRDHEIVNGQTMPRYRLADHAPRLKLDRVSVLDDAPSLGEGGTPAYPPHQHPANMPENSVSAARAGGYADVPPVRGHTPGTPVVTNTDTDTYSDTDSESVSELNEKRLESDFAALKSCVPSTDGFSYGFENYKLLRSQGFTAEEISEAMLKATAAIRAEYPERTARYMPHAERMLSRDYVHGACRFLPKRPGPVTAREPSANELYRFAIVNDLGQITREAIAVNEAITKAKGEEEEKVAWDRKKAWLAENKDAIKGAWLKKKGCE